MNEIFDTVEELAGIYPDSDSLRNAVYAIINAGGRGHFSVKNPEVVGGWFWNKLAYIAQSYEQARGISMRIGG